jgi:hypothetical protein
VRAHRPHKGLGSLEGGSLNGLADTRLSGTTNHPLLGEGLKYSAQVVGDHPDDQVNATIGLMSKYAWEDSSCPEIQAEAQALRQIYGNDPRSLVCGVWETVRGKIQFLRDESLAVPLESFMSRTYSDGSPVTPIVEILIRPRDMSNLQTSKMGDCDDYSMYSASLLIALGIPTCFVTIAGDQSNPNIFTHVYVSAYPTSSNRVAVDASHGPYCGWEVQRPGGRKQEWPVNGSGGQVGNWGPVLAMAAAGFLIGYCCL